MIFAIFILLTFLVLGEAIVTLAGIKLPGSIMGMGLLFAALQAGWIKRHWLDKLVDILMANLSLFLVPPCVAVMSYLDLIRDDIWSIIIATVASTLIVMIVTGKTHEWLRRHSR